MKIRYLALLLLAAAAVFSCTKSNDVSKIPQISLIYFGSTDGRDSMVQNIDTGLLKFGIVDGDADLGNDPSGPKDDIFVNDLRFDTGYTGYHFPAIDQSIEDPKKGIQGTCTLILTPDLLAMRRDSLHLAVGDTVRFEVYVVDRAGNKSNHIVTGPFIIRL